MGQPVVGEIRKATGIAGQVVYAATVTYPGEDPSQVQFVGSVVYGGPVVMITGGGTQVFVDDPSRFGKFGPEWVRNFFAGVSGPPRVT